jgi:hypothetical protein
MFINIHSFIDKINKTIARTKSVLQAPAPPKVMFKLRDLGYFFRFVRPIWKIGDDGFSL